MPSTDPREIIEKSPMSRMQIVVVALMVALCALDGFDLLSISFAAPGIAEEWGINRTTLGVVLSMELVGMALGAVFLGGIADKFGRRKTMLWCLCGMTIGMAMAGSAGGVISLSIWRVMTGIGIGGMLASVNAMAAEFSNAKTRHLSCSLAVVGVPLGGALGGMVAAALLVEHDWRSVFYFGAGVSALCVPILFYLVPESVYWLAQRQPASALPRINEALARMGHQAISALPVNSEPEQEKSPFRELFVPAMRKTTLLVTTVYFLHVLTFYFMMKWVPKIIVDMGFDASSAGSVLVWMNVGGIFGGAIFGMLAYRLGLRRLLAVVLFLSAILVAGLGQIPADLQLLAGLCLVAGFCTMAAMSGMYAMMAQLFPTKIRAVGTGFGIGMGRGGAIIGPIVAGVLFNAGVSLAWVAGFMALGSLLAVGALALLPREQPSEVIAEAKAG